MELFIMHTRVDGCKNIWIIQTLQNINNETGRNGGTS